jgi:hypothetical protein
VSEAGGAVEQRPAGARAPLGSWARLYILVLAALALDILLLWWLTVRYR